MDEISHNELFKLTIEADEKALQEGLEPRQRGLRVIAIVMERLNHRGYVAVGHNTPEIVKKIHALHSSLYRPSDIAIGSIHGGIFMFRDVFARVDIPIILGQLRLDPLSCTNFSKTQMKWLSSSPAHFQMFNDQFIDIFDFGGGIGNFDGYRTPPTEALEIFWLSAFQFQAAAAALSVAFDFRGAIQSALIGAELSIKAGLAAAGTDEASRRKFGHNLSSAVDALSAIYPHFDVNRTLAAVGQLPPYVANRYATTQPNRVETGHIVMKAQYVAGEVMRQVTGYSLRSALSGHSERLYPATSGHAIVGVRPTSRRP
jgi:hypothetical protein